MPDLQKVLVLGDSHAAALMAGCVATGLPAELLSFSGNFWHAGHIVAHRRLGLWARGASLQARITETLRRLERTTLFGPEVTVIASFGFHLGRIAPIFGLRGHCVSAEEFLEDDRSQFASSGLVSAYAQAFRSPHVTIMRRIRQRSPLILVTPPRFCNDSSNHRACFNAIKDDIQKAAIPCFDPCAELFGPEGVLPEGFVTPDRVHGTAEYGELVIRRLMERALLPLQE